MIVRLNILRMLCLCVVLLGATLPMAHGQTVDMRAGIHEGFGRLVFEWSQTTAYTARIADGRLEVTFQSPIAADPQILLPRLPKYLKSARKENGGRKLVFDLNGDYRLRQRVFGTSVVLDLIRVEGEKTASATSKTSPKLITVPVRVGFHRDYTRLVFDWPKRSTYRITYKDGQATLRFADPARINLAAVHQALPQDLKTFAITTTAPLTVTMPSPSRPKHFRAGRSGNSVVLDIPKTAASKAPARTEAKETPKSKSTAAEPPKPQAVPVAKVETPKELPEIVDVPAPMVQPGRVVSLSFSWNEPTGAAVFRRGGYIWAVFDRAHSVDTKLMRRMGEGLLLDVEQVKVPNGTAVRILAPSNYNPSLRREGLLWIVDIMAQSLRPVNPIKITALPQRPEGVKWFLPMNEGGAVLNVVDPEIGDTMMVVPVIPLGHGIEHARQTVDLEMPVTAQGVVVYPRTDNLEVSSNRNGIDIGRDGGLRLSKEATISTALATPTGENAVIRAFDLAEWQRDGEDAFVKDRLGLREAVMEASQERKNFARMDLARFFFAHRYGAEALGVLRTIAADNPQRMDQPDFLAVQGGANYLMHRWDNAIKAFSHETLAGSTEAQFWNALAKVKVGDDDGTGENTLIIRAGAPILKDYPDRLRTRLALDAAEALANVGDDVGVNNFLEAAKRDNLSIQEQAEMAYLKGRMHASTGALESAISDWEEAEDTFVRPFRARAAFNRILLQRQMDQISMNDAIENLDRLRFAWRGDDFEYKLLDTLARMNLDDKRYADGLRILRQMVSYFRDRPESKTITELMRSTFRELYLNGRADDLPPVRAIGLFEEFRELTPPGAEGDEMIRKLADRLVSVDLLQQAAQLLEHQVDARLKDVEKSRVGARLALVYLLDRKPSLALAALKKTTYDKNPNGLAEQRKQLRARALADLGQDKNALAVLAADNSDETNLLKAEIQWREQNWPGAADALAQTVRPPAEGAQMSQDMRQRVLQLATALRLSDQRRDIALLRRDYLRYMNSTAEFDAFNLLTSQTSSGLIDLQTVEAQIKQAESFRSFMGDYKDRMKEGGLSAIN